jgi:hypothetical protein
MYSEHESNTLKIQNILHLTNIKDDFLKNVFNNFGYFTHVQREQSKITLHITN